MFYVNKLGHCEPGPAGPYVILSDSGRSVLGLPESEKITYGPAGFPFLRLFYCLKWLIFINFLHCGPDPAGPYQISSEYNISSVTLWYSKKIRYGPAGSGLLSITWYI